MSDQRKMIGVVAKSLDGSFNGAVMAGIVNKLKKHHYGAVAIQLPWTESSPLYDESYGLDLIDGWIVLNESASPEFFKKVHERHVPIVSINRIEHAVPCSSMMIDNVQGMYIATEHLIKHGHEHIAFIGDLTNPNIRRRFEGYKRALNDHRIAYEPDLTVNTATSSYSGSYAAAEALLGKVDRFSAFVSANDAIASGFATLLKKEGMRIPEDVAGFGFNNDLNAILNDISTVQLPAYELGQQAVDTIIKQRKGEDVARILTLQCSLVLRSSCGCEAVTQEEKKQDMLVDQALNDRLLQLIDQFRSVNFHLMRDRELDLLRTTWLLDMDVSGLALWREDESGAQQIEISDYFNSNHTSKQLANQRMPSEQFPPVEHFFSQAVDGTGTTSDMVFLYLLHTERSKHGALVFSGQFPQNTQQVASVLFMSMLAESIAANMDLDLILTETKEQKDSYQSIAQQLSTISEMTSDGIWILDLKQDYIHWYNNHIQVVLGLDDERIMSSPTNFMKHVHPSDLALVVEKFEHHMIDREPFHIVFRLLKNDGTYIWITSHCKALSDDEEDTRIIGSIQDITAIKQADEQIQYLAYHDALTGLLNRRAFVERLEDIIGASANSRERLAIIFFDLDRFKMVNDSYGHHVGDRVLIEVAQRIKKQLPQQAVFCRLGGDEFMIMLPNIVQREEIARLAQHIIDCFVPSFRYDQHEFHLGGSLGLSIYPDDGDNAVTLMKNADIAMRRAKHNGKNQMEWYSPEMQLHTQEWLSVENGLVKALQSDEFVLYYQPQMSLRTGKLVGAEALVRWNSAERGLVPPRQFIPIAEETGLIVPIGEVILRQACEQIKLWADRYDLVGEFVCSVNISARQFEQHQFVQSVRQILEETGIEPGMICLEITESMAINDVDFYIRQLGELSKLGLHLALDDFGTGYSSLDVLRRLPINLVKIDRSFIQNMKTNRDDLAIVQSIISLSHNLNKLVVAEGVEHDDHKEILGQAKCDFYQGYLMSEPIPAEKFEDSFFGNRQPSLC